MTSKDLREWNQLLFWGRDNSFNIFFKKKVDIFFNIFFYKFFPHSFFLKVFFLNSNFLIFNF